VSIGRLRRMWKSRFPQRFPHGGQRKKDRTRELPHCHKLLTPFILKLLKDASLTTSVRRGTWGCYSPRVFTWMQRSPSARDLIAVVLWPGSTKKPIKKPNRVRTEMGSLEPLNLLTLVADDEAAGELRANQTFKPSSTLGPIRRRRTQVKRPAEIRRRSVVVQ
jgi:hypothetical protein